MVGLLEGRDGWRLSEGKGYDKLVSGIRFFEFVAPISVKDLEFLEKIKAGPPEDGLLGAVGMEPELAEVAEKTMEGYQRRADDFGREVKI